jgi:acyl-CoA hydrolase
MNKLTPKSAKESQVEMTEIVLPHHANAIGTVFGGTVMSWVDTAAAACALRHCHQQVVTASVDAMHFLAPIKLGWIATVRASINFTSKTSCEVGVRIEAENPLTGERFHTASAYVTMVAIGSDGKPASMPPLVVISPEEKRRHAEATERRRARLQLRADLERSRIQNTHS